MCGLAEVTFEIRKSQFGRKGWKVMPENDLDLRVVGPKVIEMVMLRIRDLDYSGHPVPERMTIRLGEQ